MKKYFLDKSINLIKKYYNYDDVKLKEIRYGLETIYLTITKTIVIFILAYFLKIFKELILIFAFYGLLRLTGHGLHAKKSLHCWVASLLSFTLLPYLAKIVTFDFYSKLIICVASIILIAIYSPADTEKKPIVKKKKRIVLKVLTIITSTIYSILSFIIKDNLIINVLIFSMITEITLILPLSYKIFGLKYNNYKIYLQKKLLNAWYLYKVF